MPTYWECTYSDNFGLETTKTCYTSCCEHDCCPESANAGLIAGITVPICILVFFLVLCCRLYVRRRALARQTVVTVPTRGIIVTSTSTTVHAGAPVPQHQGYDQPGYQPSTMPKPAVYQPPPPYTEQPPQAVV